MKRNHTDGDGDTEEGSSKRQKLSDENQDEGEELFKKAISLPFFSLERFDYLIQSSSFSYPPSFILLFSSYTIAKNTEQINWRIPGKENLKERKNHYREQVQTHINWYFAQAKLGHGFAQFSVAYLFTCGGKKLYSFTKDSGLAENMGEQEIIRLFKASSKQGFGLATYHLSAAWEGSNEKKMIKYLKKAADEGDCQALYCLGVRYLKKVGVEQNFDLAFKCFKAAADQGDIFALTRLGRCYQRGHGVEKNFDKCFELFTISAHDGDQKGQEWLGWCYEKGRGTSVNYERAHYYYTLAANQGCNGAYYALASFYDNGKGIEEDPTQAFIYYKKAADNGGHVNCIYNVACALLNGDGVDVNPAMALKYCLMGVSRNDAGAAFMAGRLLSDGEEGIPQDKKLGEMYLQLSVDGGCERGLDRIGSYVIGGRFSCRAVQNPAISILIRRHSNGLLLPELWFLIIELLLHHRAKYPDNNEKKRLEQKN